ncbi:MAG: hypothetical protein GX567_15380, partial [Clostridia bacterium]|nr:hypothetical protein [Clostridia bacterium]
MIYDQNATTFDSSELNYNEMEARYLRQLNAMTEMNDKNLIAKGRHNLTLNRTEYYQRKREEALELYQGDNYEQNVKSLAKLAILPEMQEEIRQTLDRKKLLRDYERGILEGSVEYQRVSEAFDFFWVLTKYSLLRIPSTGEIAIFVYSYDVTNRVINSQIVAKLSSLEYDGIGLLNIKTHQYQLKGILTKLEGPRIVGEGDYDERVRERLSVNILPEEREEALKNFSVDHIVKQLENKEVYFFAYSIKDDEGNIRRKKMQFLYLDKVKFMVLYCRSDITSLYRKEQEQLRQTERALLAEQEAKKAKTFFLSRMSHDIRTPLNTIINLARMITEELDDKEAARADLKKMETANQFLLSLVNDILDMSKIEQRNIKLNSEIYSYSE